MRSQLAALVLALGLVAVWTDGAAGVQRVRFSARGTVEATVDGIHVSMEYGRPTKRGRDIWGALVPWGRWWMPGADEATSIVTSGALRLGTLRMPAGTHTIYTLPDPQTFTLIINNQTGQFHTVYHADRDLGRVPMTLRRLPEIVEEMTFAVEPGATGGGVLALRWDDREYSVALAADR